jgi:hypothetical protein
MYTINTEMIAKVVANLPLDAATAAAAISAAAFLVDSGLTFATASSASFHVSMIIYNAGLTA